MSEYLVVNPQKNVKISVFTIINKKTGEVSFRLIIHDPTRIDGEDNDYIIYDCNTFVELTEKITTQFTGIGRGDIMTINTTPPGQLQFIKERNQLVECRPLSSDATHLLGESMKRAFGIK